jgi:A/G-specific adenine glycosylase
MSFGEEIIKWYEVNKRDLPWRQTRNPYLIWLSEIILQQTRIEQGLSYYYLFAEKFPEVKSLASAKEDDVLKLWQGLGYYSRARNLHAASKQIMKEHGGNFPDDYDSIRALKGVGEYTAAAISSFAYDLKYPVVDGNVFRLLSRYFGIKTPIDSSSGRKEFTSLAAELMEGFPPAIFNQAIMEFGSKQCKPSNPLCESCPLNIGCFSFKNKSISQFPVKKNKVKLRKRYFNYLVIRNEESFYIRQRKGKDIWQGLHDFPLIETNKNTNENVLFRSAELKKIFTSGKLKVINVSEEYKHILSHQTIHAKFYELSVDKKKFNEPPSEWKKVNPKTVKKYAIPRLIERYLDSIS